MHADVVGLGHYGRCPKRLTSIAGALHKTSMYKPQTSKKKPWFDADCDTARKRYLHDKNYYRRIKTVDSYDTMVNSSKCYKKTINKKYSGDRKDTVSKISSQVFYEHFIKLNQSVVDDNDVAFQDFDDTSVEYSNDLITSKGTGRLASIENKGGAHIIKEAHHVKLRVPSEFLVFTFGVIVDAYRLSIDGPLSGAPEEALHKLVLNLHNPASRASALARRAVEPASPTTLLMEGVLRPKLSEWFVYYPEGAVKVSSSRRSQEPKVRET
ncbi:hypothetical protein MAR_033083, partial [Mya arenaria]